MSRTPWGLIGKHLRAHWFRSFLTFASVVLALFLFCFLISIVTSLEALAKGAASNRVVVQSAVSLFVELPRDYQQKIAGVAGVEHACKFQWFGGFWKEQKNFFAQFAVDPDVFFDMYKNDFEIVEVKGSAGGDLRAAAAKLLAEDRRATVVGEGLVRDYQWKIGDSVPIIGTIFQKSDGTAWDFNVVAVYRPTKANFDDRTMFFRYDYLSESLDAGQATGPFGVGTYAVNVVSGYDPAAVIRDIDALFANGPQRTLTSTEAAFNASFVSMWGNLPMFLGTIGGAVVFAVFFLVVNVMLMASRQRVHEAGILKAVGFPDGVLARLMLGESLVLTLCGGAAGIALAWFGAVPMRRVIGKFMPNFAVAPETALWAAGLALFIGLVAGAAPAVRLARMRPTAALRSE
jgi:putative ABC transport system permease protein